MPTVTRLPAKDLSRNLDEIAREGARQMLAQALEAEVADYIARNQQRNERGRSLVVRNGKARARKVTISGTIEVRASMIAGRLRTAASAARSCRTYMRRSPKVAEVLPILFLRGLSTNDFKEGLAALLGEDASGLSPAAITRLTAAGQADHEAFQKRDVSDRDDVYVWADGWAGVLRGSIGGGIANVLDKLPRRLHAKAKTALNEVMRADTRKAQCFRPPTRAACRDIGARWVERRCYYATSAAAFSTGGLQPIS